jgi:hypothetical protein
MEEDDPEKRIAELERQLSDAKPYPRADVGRQARAKPSALGKGRIRPWRRWLIWGGVAASIIVVAIIALVMVVVIRVGNDLAPAHLLSADGLNGMLTSMRSHFGDTIGIRMYVFTDHALLGRADPNDGRRTNSYEYDGRDWSNWDGSAASSGDTSVDLSQFDVAAVIATVSNAPKSFDFTQPEDTNLIVSGAEGNLNLEVHVHDHGLSGWMELKPDGTIKEVHSPD